MCGCDFRRIDGTVTSYDKAKAGFLIKFDDGDCEVTDLIGRRVRLV
jgi:hypothetical protein